LSTFTYKFIDKKYNFQHLQPNSCDERHLKNHSIKEKEVCIECVLQGKSPTTGLDGSTWRATVFFSLALGDFSLAPAIIHLLVRPNHLLVRQTHLLVRLITGFPFLYSDFKLYLLSL
jgi:hypothetical protein